MIDMKFVKILWLGTYLCSMLCIDLFFRDSSSAIRFGDCVALRSPFAQVLIGILLCYALSEYRLIYFTT